MSKVEDEQSNDKRQFEWNTLPAVEILRKNENHQDLIVVPEVFSQEECEKIIRDGGENGFNDGVVFDKSKRSEEKNKETWIVNPSIRQTDVGWIDLSQPKFNWIYDRIVKYLEAVNDDVWGYDLAEPYLIQGLQLGKYKKDSFYGWHTDSWAGQSSIRRLSMTIQLTNPNEYEGGKFEIFRGEDPDYKEDPNIEKLGSLILFPSYIWHKVTPVTKGVRFSLVGWCLGNTIV